MNVNLYVIFIPFHSSGQLAVAWFTLFDVIFLIILIPVFDRFIYPRLERAGYPVTMVARISVGMLFATLAVLIAGVVELFRLKSVWPNDSQPCCSSTINQTIGNVVGIFSWVPIFVDWTKITQSFGSKFMAIIFTFIFHTENCYFVGTLEFMDWALRENHENWYPRKIKSFTYMLS